VNLFFSRPIRFLFSAIFVFVLIFVFAEAAFAQIIPFISILNHPAFIAALFASTLIIKLLIAMAYTRRYNPSYIALFGAVSLAWVVAYPVIRLLTEVLNPAGNNDVYKAIFLIVSMAADYKIYTWRFGAMYDAKLVELPVSGATITILAIVPNIVVLMLQPYIIMRLMVLFMKMGYR